MSKSQLKWNNPILRRQSNGSISPTNSVQKYQKYRSKSKQHKQSQVKAKQFKVIHNLKNNITHITHLQTQKLKNSITCDIKKIKRGFDQANSYNKTRQKTILQKNHLKKLLKQATNILKTINCLLNDIKEFYINLKEESISAVQKMVFKTQNKISSFSNVRKVESISLNQKYDIGQVQTNLTHHLRQSSIKNNIEWNELQYQQKPFELSQANFLIKSYHNNQIKQSNPSSSYINNKPRLKTETISSKQLFFDKSKEITTVIKEKIHQLSKMAKIYQY